MFGNKTWTVNINDKGNSVNIMTVNLKMYQDNGENVANVLLFLQWLYFNFQVTLHALKISFD